MNSPAKIKLAVNSSIDEEISTQVNLSIGENSQFAELTFNGSVSRKLMDDSFFLLIDHPNFKRNMNAYYDFSDVFIELEMSEIQQHAQFVASRLNIRGGSYKLALISNDTLNYALLEIYKLLISNTSVKAKIFHSVKQARLWLSRKA